MVKKITFGNFKGGTGKTTNSCLISYHLAKKGYKTLLVDLDPQANATSLLLLTRQNQFNDIIKFETTLMSAIYAGSLKPIVTPINDNLSLLPSFADFTSYPLFLEKEYPNDMKKRVMHFNELLTEIENDFDYIIFDIPPTLSAYTDAAMFCSDEVVIVLQTQERSFVGAEAFVQYMQDMIDVYDLDFDILGILPVLLKNNSIVDKSVLKNAIKTFGASNVFTNVIRNMERLKRYDITGIVDAAVNEKYDVHDNRVHELFSTVTEELLTRINKGVAHHE